MLEVFKMVLKVEGMAKSFQNKHIFKLYLLFELGKNFTKFFGLSRWEVRVFSQTDFGIMINKPYMTHYPKISLGTWSVQLQSDSRLHEKQEQSQHPFLSSSNFQLSTDFTKFINQLNMICASCLNRAFLCNQTINLFKFYTKQNVGC